MLQKIVPILILNLIVISFFTSSLVWANEETGSSAGGSNSATPDEKGVTSVRVNTDSGKVEGVNATVVVTSNAYASETALREALAKKSSRPKGQSGGCITTFNTSDVKEVENYIEIPEINNKDDCRIYGTQKCDFFAEKHKDLFFKGTKSRCESSMNFYWVEGALENNILTMFSTSNKVSGLFCQRFGHVSRWERVDSATVKSFFADERTNIPALQKDCLANTKDEEFVCEIKWFEPENFNPVKEEKFKTKNINGSFECSKKAMTYIKLCDEKSRLSSQARFTRELGGEVLQETMNRDFKQICENKPKKRK